MKRKPSKYKLGDTLVFVGLPDVIMSDYNNISHDFKGELARRKLTENPMRYKELNGQYLEVIGVAPDPHNNSEYLYTLKMEKNGFQLNDIPETYSFLKQIEPPVKGVDNLLDHWG